MMIFKNYLLLAFNTKLRSPPLANRMSLKKIKKRKRKKRLQLYMKHKHFFFIQLI